jgi:hypothetical protein
VCGAGEGTKREGEGRRGDGTLLLKIIIIIYIIVIVSGHKNSMLTHYPVLTASNWRSLALCPAWLREGRREATKGTGQLREAGL